MFHPVALLTAWASCAITVQWLPLTVLLPVGGVCAVSALVCARPRSLRLLSRTRWLLLSVLVLFIFTTPGEFLPGWSGQLGMTVEGLTSGVTHLLRLLTLLLSLAILHEALGNAGLMAALHGLLRGMPARDRTVARLVLTLEVADRPQPSLDWHSGLFDEDVDEAGMSACQIESRELRGRDVLLMVLAAMAVLAGWVLL